MPSLKLIDIITVYVFFFQIRAYFQFHSVLAGRILSFFFFFGSPILSGSKLKRTNPGILKVFPSSTCLFLTFYA